MTICATRGCAQEVAAPGGRPLLHCAPCLLGTRKIAASLARANAVDRLPPVVVPAGGWGFRMPGSPRSYNNALGRGHHVKTYLKKWAKDWKCELGLRALATRPADWNLAGRYAVEIRSWFSSNASDVDGPVKLTLDALKGIAWFDDRQVLSHAAYKLVDRELARIEVVIRNVTTGTAP